ncbi:MAG: glutamate racemase, partial [Lachnospiraceae bacterium]|nr:glutamate racemase [Lachnospiraceae bacterium]
EKFQKLMAKYDDMGNIIPLPCPGLMEFVERGDLEGEDLRTYIINLFHDIDTDNIDSIVLGCTHYPFAKKMIKSVVGERIKIYDGGEGTAREMKRRLSQSGLLNEKKENGNVIFINSKDTQEEIYLCDKLLKLPF